MLATIHLLGMQRVLFFLQMMFLSLELYKDDKKVVKNVRDPLALVEPPRMEGIFVASCTWKKHAHKLITRMNRKGLCLLVLRQVIITVVKDMNSLEDECTLNDAQSSCFQFSTISQSSP